MAKTSKSRLRPGASEEVLATLEARFAYNMHRHAGIRWEDVQARLEGNSDSLRALNEMEQSGGEPDVIDRVDETGEYLFVDCSAQSPGGRRSLCYDAEALEARKKHKPVNSAVAMAAAMGATLLTEAQYRRLQEVGEFDTTTSSWLHTPPDIRALGGAIFGDYRFRRMFVYHNGAESYYAGRGFRCVLTV